MKRRLKVYQKRYSTGKYEIEDVKQRLQSWIGHLKHGHTYRLREKISKTTIYKRGERSEK